MARIFIGSRNQRMRAELPMTDAQTVRIKGTDQQPIRVEELLCPDRTYENQKNDNENNIKKRSSDDWMKLPAAD
jgi:hypothetical protein